MSINTVNKDLEFQYLWSYFDRHSEQRMTMFNYYIVVIMAIITAIAICLKESSTLGNFLILPALLLIFINHLFKRIDQRTAYLIKISETALKSFEAENFAPSSHLISIEEHKTALDRGVNISTYGMIFKYVFNLIEVIAFTFVAISFYNLWIFCTN